MFQRSMHYLRKIEHWLLPYTCILCKKTPITRRDLCHTCEQALPLLKNSCQHCAYPLDKLSISNDCHFCIKKSLPFDSIHALYLYQPPITQLILGLKFNHVLVNARLLGEILAEKIQNSWYANKMLPQSIIPVPLHATRLRERGFNQAIEIAKPVAKAIKRPLRYFAADRIKATFAQATLNAIERRQNIQNAFSVREDVHNQHIAVIDDVITTGETASELCIMLKQAGAHRVDLWCCARATNE